MSNELEPTKCKIIADLSKLKIDVTLSYTVEQWRDFVVSAEKTGGKLQRLMADQVRPLLDKVKEAAEVLK